MSLIPSIDISNFSRASTSAKIKIADEVDTAAQAIGFMQITGHGIPDAAIENLKDAIDGFFALSISEKNQWCPPSVAINRGYTSPMSERLSYSSGVVSAADLFEAFNVGTAASEFPQFQLDPNTYPENIWPTQPSYFQPYIAQWFLYAAGVARQMTRIFEYALDLEPNYFASMQDHSLDVLRVNHYAMLEGLHQIDKQQMGMGAHTDYGIVTVLWADAVSPGLQVLSQDGHWIDVVPAPGALLINLGDLMARWTNDRWLSSMHRVLPPIDASGQIIRRRSAAFFHDGDADAVIRCLATCASPQNPPRYSEITVGQHIQEKLAGSRGLQVNLQAEKESERILKARN
jgi:isopenicillin N synthase-like dioxygenase